MAGRSRHRETPARSGARVEQHTDDGQIESGARTGRSIGHCAWLAMAAQRSTPPISK